VGHEQPEERLPRLRGGQTGSAWQDNRSEAVAVQ